MIGRYVFVASDLGLHCLPMSHKKGQQLGLNGLAVVMSCADFYFFKLTFSNYFQNLIRVLNNLDPDRDS